MAYTILTINPGSTSTKIGVFEDEKELFSQNVAHSSEMIATFPTMASQYEFREYEVRKAFAERKFDLHRLSVIVGRGGVLRPIPGGVYRITEAMKRTLETARYGEHASNLGALIADRLAREIGVPAFIVDPVVVDELDDVARVSGHRLFQRRSIFHALNQKAVARRWCREHGRSYEEATLVVVHMGGGVSVGLHDKGRVVDVNNALNGEGPFSPERSGTLPAGDLVRLCFSGKYQEREILRMITGQGGLVSFMGTNDMRVAEKGFHENDKAASLYYRAFIYQVGKAIGALGAAAKGRAEAIVLTGGVAYGKEIVEGISAMCDFIAPIVVYPGEGELEALAEAGRRVMSGEIVAGSYEED